MQVQINTDKNIENISIFDLSGKLLIRDDNPSSEINVSDLNVGTYLINVTIEGSVQSSKFIKSQ